MSTPPLSRNTGTAPATKGDWKQHASILAQGRIYAFLLQQILRNNLADYNNFVKQYLDNKNEMRALSHEYHENHHSVTFYFI